MMTLNAYHFENPQNTKQFCLLENDKNMATKKGTFFFLLRKYFKKLFSLHI